MITRILEKKILERMFKGKVIIVYGARQVWKTTLSKKILQESPKKSKYINCDLYPIQELLDATNPQKFIDYFLEYELVVFDEAQNITNIGMVLKILLEKFPEKQFIATGSSSFELANKINEPLTGRNFKFILYGLSIEEIRFHYDSFFIDQNLENLLIYGSYPEIFWVNLEAKQESLNLISGDYLYKDIFKFEGIKKSQHIKSILQMLALQVGSEVSYSEIGQKLWISHLTVQKYINILESAFIIFSLRSFSRNLRNEITRGVKIYFYDLWVRNSLIQNYSSLNLRQDIWALWENFLILERKKLIEYHIEYRNMYFWRNHAQAEIDYIEEYAWMLSAYEFKWKVKNAKIPKSFQWWYPHAHFETVHKENFLNFVTKTK